MIKIPFVDLSYQTSLIKSDVFNRYNKIIDKSLFLMGNELDEFESNFSIKVNSKYTLGLSSGYDGNFLAIKCLNIAPGDEVILPVNTYIATANAIVNNGAKPVFVDVCGSSFNIDVEKIEKAITKKTKAINPVHLYGQPAEMDKILKIAKINKLHVIEDAAQAHCAIYKDKNVGSIGDAASWSFYPGKNMGAWGDAGALTTQDISLYEKAFILRNQGSNTQYKHPVIGFNLRMSELTASVLNEKMKHIISWTDARIKIARLYSKLLKNIQYLKTPVENSDSKHVYHLYVIKAKNRNRLQNYLQKQGIETKIHYPNPLHLEKAYNFLNYQKGDFPIAEKLSNQILSLPIYPGLSNKHILFIAEKIKEFYS